MPAEVGAVSRAGTVGTGRAGACPAWLKDRDAHLQGRRPREMVCSDVHSPGLCVCVGGPALPRSP